MTISRDTIVALASGGGLGGVAVVRVSGPVAATIAKAMTGRAALEPRRAVRAHIRGTSGEPIDDGLMLWFPGPKSFTGEDIVEFQVHGGRAVVNRVVNEVCFAARARLAEPGEFTKRAVLAGKLDLTRAEGLADLIGAETEFQRKQAFRQLGGALFDVYEAWRTKLVRTMAHLEATIDFSDQEIPDDLLNGVDRDIDVLLTQIEAHLKRGRKAERLRDGLFVSILGAPNVGKSSLLNRLAGREAAIVSDQAGTTRDALEVHLDLHGIPVVLIDTAGIRETDDRIEAEGVRRALARGREADLKVVMVEANRWPDLDKNLADLVDDATIVVVNKSDQAESHRLRTAERAGHLTISVLTGSGLDAFEETIAERAAALVDGAGEPAPTRERHRQCLEYCVRSLRRAQCLEGIEMRAEELRIAASSLGRLTGRVDVEDLLDVVFSDFCIGK